MLQAAEREARELSDQYVSTEHLLLALSADDGRAGAALRAVGASHERPATGARRGAGLRTA